MPRDKRKVAAKSESAAWKPSIDPAAVLSLTVPSDPKLLGVVRSAMTSLAEALGFAPADCSALTRSVDEALANIIRHAYRLQQDQPIHIHCRRLQADSEKKAGLEINLIDYGPAFNPTAFPPRSLDEVRPGGLGLHFMREAMNLSYQRIGAANHLRMVKYLPTASNTRGLQ